MKKILVALVCIVALIGCKDEKNLPEYNSYVDSTPPSIEIVTPLDNQEFTGTNIIDLQYNLRDDYKLASFSLRIIPSDIDLSEFSDEIQIDDSIYTYSNQYTLPSSDPMTYEVNISAQDSLGFGTNKVYFFTYE